MRWQTGGNWRPASKSLAVGDPAKPTLAYLRTPTPAATSMEVSKLKAKLRSVEVSLANLGRLPAF